ncbi:hypothetical protein PQX77_020704 [Marasmius sp. AFHP31]|nr:hypothetical protein PQX77_020704 [Marasmius sp. AFHP31]
MAPSEPIAQALEPFLSMQTVIIRPIGTLSSSSTVGIYAVTFGISLNVAFRRRGSTASKVFMSGVVSLFVLITVMNAAVAWSVISDTILIYDTIRTQDYVALSKYLSLTDRHFTSRVIQLYVLYAS